MVERLHGTIRQRNKLMRGLDEESTAQTMMDGIRTYYNFVRPHIALNGKTPAQRAGIDIESKWLFLIKKTSKQRFDFRLQHRTRKTRFLTAILSISGLVN